MFQLTKALVLYSFVFATFGVLQNITIVVGFAQFILGVDGDKTVMGLGQLIGSVGIIIRAPVLLLLEPVRDAFSRGIRGIL